MVRAMLPLLVVITCVTATEFSLFDDSWRFYRGDSPKAATASGSSCAVEFCRKSFDDSHWSPTETPHDWAIEDLPSRATDPVFPVLDVRNGAWLFSPDDHANFANASFDDSGWMTVSVPHDWRDPPSNHSGANLIGWYRRHVPAATGAQMAAAEAGTLKLGLGTVANQAVVYLNGVSIGSTGDLSKPDSGCASYLTYHTFVVPSGLLSSHSSNVVAVQVRSGPDSSQPGGLYDSMAADERSGPFDPAASPGQKQTGYTVAGVGWYRKHFQNPGLPEGHRTFLRFDGVYMHATVYLNEAQLATHPYGYTTFELDVTEALTAGSNVLAIRVQSNGSNSRWYAGAGIFRHVHLGSAPAVHSANFGGLLVVAPQSGINLVARTATVTVTATVHNDGHTAATATVTAQILPPALGSAGGLSAAVLPQQAQSVVRILPGAKTNLTFTFPVSDAQFWSPDTPSLYTAALQVDTPGGVDKQSSSFGIRKLSFDSTHGFKLNGVTTKLRGGCVHHDNGPLGSRAIDRAEERRVETLKAAGYNAIRTSHNPVSPAFVAACDRLGMLLMEEAFDCWDQGKNTDDYHLYFDDWWQRDVTWMVLRDFNSPSIIMWSIGNEIPNRGTARGISLSKQLAEFIRVLDPTSGNGRAVTSAYPGPNEDDTTDQYLAPLDVAGYNYAWSHYVPAHQRVPGRVLAGTESFPAESFQTWQAVLNNSWVIGDFIWTAIDYIGESAIGGTGYNTPDLKACAGYCPQGWGWHISFCGDIDLVGHRKPQSLYRTVMWNVSQLEIAVHEPVPAGQKEVIASWGWPTEHSSWSWAVPEGTKFSINVYSRYPTVRLFLNGNPVGPRTAVTQHTATFSDVGYQHGQLTAVGYDSEGTARENRTVVTAGSPAKIRLSADRSNIRAERSDLSYVTAEVVDASGVLVHDASIELSFDVMGVGELAAVGSGDPADVGSFYVSTRRTYLGKAIAIVRPGFASKAPSVGDITLTARGPGLQDASVTITVQ